MRKNASINLQNILTIIRRAADELGSPQNFGDVPEFDLWS